MAYETRELSGSIFKNTKKEKPGHPDKQGKCLIGGKLYYISGWDKETKSGEPWLSLSFKPADSVPQTAEPRPVNTEAEDPFEV